MTNAGHFDHRMTPDLRDPDTKQTAFAFGCCQGRVGCVRLLMEADRHIWPLDVVR